MGVVNVTPDSFSDGGRFLDPQRAANHGLKLISEGADILDVGGESTRPGARPVSESEELERVIPVIRSLRRSTDIPLSIDTTKAAVASAALDEGADIVNDISALRSDPGMARIIAGAGAGVILMHMQGTPLTMQRAPHYDDLVDEIRSFLQERTETAASSGIPEEGIIIDPGIGFGKTCEHNLTLLRSLEAFTDLGRPLCIGLSRKSFIGKVLDLPVEERLEGTIAAAVLSISLGASILRVHDVREVTRAVQLAEAILGTSPASVVGGNRKAGYAC